MSSGTLKIGIGADHGALEMKNALLTALQAEGYDLTDYGTNGEESVDYPDFANLVAPEVAAGTHDFGILLCTSGIGMSIAANRFEGARAAKVDRTEEAVTTREHNDSNILCIGSRFVSIEDAVEIAKAFLTTKFEGGRHQRRVCKAGGSALAQSDPEVQKHIDDELHRQRNHIELIASENFASRAVIEAQGSVLTNKYAEGYPGKRWYGGCEHVDEIEQIAIDRAKELFGAEHANVQPHSGSQANTAVYFSVLAPGDKILTMDLSHGGHLTHGHKANFSGVMYNVIHYGVSDKDEQIDYDSLERVAKAEKPRLITCGASAYPRVIDFERMAKIAKAVDAYLFVDMAHIAGLVAGGEHPNPCPHADFVTSTTHKSLRGPRGGIILCKEKYAKRIDAQVFPGIQGGPLMHVIAAKAVCFGEALKPCFKDYQAQVVKNAQTLAERLKEHGYRIVSGGTENHVLLVDLQDKGFSGSTASKALDKCGITVNKNSIPFDSGSAVNPGGIRLGTPAITTRGMKEADVIQVADFIHEGLENRKNAEALAALQEKVFAFNQQFPLPQ